MNVAIITGASSGIGKRFCERINELGKFDELWILARRKDRLLELEEKLNVPCKVLDWDLTDDSSIEKLKVSLPGVALCFGSAFKIPLFAKFDAPNPPPFSANAQIGNSWFTDTNEIVNTVVKSVDNKVNDTIEILQ